MALLQPAQTLDPFLDVFGNQYKRTHILAIRFKRHILHYTPSPLDSTLISPPHNSIVTVRGKCPPICHDPTHDYLLFTEDICQANCIQVPDFSTERLLRLLFPDTLILYSYFKSDVLYIVASQNPLQSILKKCPKSLAFKTLYTLWKAYHDQRDLTFQELSQLRLFKRYDHLLQRGNRWSPLAFALCYQHCVKRTGSMPCASLGRDLFLILKRSQNAPGQLPPDSFYQCEILFTDTEPLGAMYLLQVDGKVYSVRYVSPMVVTEPTTFFRDSGSVICNAWLPFYRNATAWNAYGMKRYLEKLVDFKLQIQFVMDWLKRQDSEKYRFILLDFVQVYKILSGVEA